MVNGRIANSRALVQYAKGEAHEKMLAATGDRHANYCLKFRADFHIGDHNSNWSGPPRLPFWRKIELLLELLPQYEKVLWLDADSIIVTTDFDVFSAAGFGIACCECWNSPTLEKHLNTGVILCHRSPEVMQFLSEWNQFQGNWRWEDQAIFNHLMVVHKRDLLTILPNRFNCTAEHMEAVDPFIRSFHGSANKLKDYMQRYHGPRKAAKALGLKHYWTGAPCKNGHVDKRIVSNGALHDVQSSRIAKANMILIRK